MDLEVTGKTILCVAAHADDLDFGSSGSIAKFCKERAKVFYLILTDGSKGSEDMSIPSEKLIETRKQEQIKAAKILGVRQVRFGHFVDGELQNTPEVRYKIVSLIRKLKPEIVLTMDPTFVYNEEFGFINHPDHRNAGQATLDCVFPFARNSRTFPDLLEKGLAPHSVMDILLTNFTKANFYVDITKTLDLKIKAIEAHKSQLEDVEKFKNMVMERAKTVGKKKGMAYAEAFVKISLRR